MLSKYSRLCVLLLYYYHFTSAGSFIAFENSSNTTSEKCILAVAKTSFPNGSLIAIAATHRNDTTVANNLMDEMKWNFLTRNSSNMASDNVLVSSNKKKCMNFD